LVIWDDSEKRQVAQIVFQTKIVDLLVVGNWVLVAQADKVFPFNFEEDLRQSGFEQGIKTNIQKRGLIDLYVDNHGAKIVVPSDDKNKKGYAHVITIPNKLNIQKGEDGQLLKESQGQDYYIDVTFTPDKKMYQIIRFVKDGSMLAAATHDGKLLKFVSIKDGETDGGTLVQEVCRGKAPAQICSISVKKLSEI